MIITFKEVNMPQKKREQETVKKNEASSETEMIQLLEDCSTPTVSNTVATYPGDPNCLGLYDPWVDNWYTNQSVRGIYPDIGRKAGYVSTVIFAIFPF